MLKKTLLLTLTVFGGCASTPPAAPPEEAPAPVEISEAPPAAEAPPPPPPDAPPPDSPQKPQQTDSGRFRISIASMDSVEATAPWVQKAEAAGYRTEILAVEIEGKTWQRVLLPGYASLAEAQAALPFVQQELGAPSAWVTSRRRAPGPADATAGAPPPPAPDMPAPAPDAPAPPAPEAPPTPAN